MGNSQTPKCYFQSISKCKSPKRPFPESWNHISYWIGDAVSSENIENSVRFASELYYYLLQPRPFLTRMVRNIKKKIGFTHPIVSIFVRHGDKVHEGSLTSFLIT